MTAPTDTKQPKITTPAPIPAIEFHAPLVNPSPTGLFAATSWTEEVEPLRWLGEGVSIRRHNYGGEQAFGVWDATWCAQPDDLKNGSRPSNLDAFEPMVVWAYDECDLTAPSQDEVRQRAAQNLRLQEQTAIEREFAARLKLDAGAPATAADLTAAVAAIEGKFAEAGTLGFIHASPKWAAVAAGSKLLLPGGTSLRSPLGHTWVFGGGYVKGLGDTLIGTSQPLGWRAPAVVREAIDAEHNVFAAIAERAVVIGYEALVGSVTVTG